MPGTPRKSAVCALITVALAAAAAVALGGCYERVISAKGLGADQYQVSEPYQSDSAVDKWLFGPQQKPKAGRSMQ